MKHLRKPITSPDTARREREEETFNTNAEGGLACQRTAAGPGVSLWPSREARGVCSLLRAPALARSGGAHQAGRPNKQVGRVGTDRPLRGSWQPKVTLLSSR